MFEQYRKIHFVGIGGIGMSGIAEVLKNLNYEVTGSDIKDSPTIRKLESIGIKVKIGHNAPNIENAHVVVTSSAIDTTNPEVIEARKRSIPVIPRAEMLAELGRLKYGILVAGSHGKTTTTSLTSTILSHAGIDPTVVIGGKLVATNSNVMLGKGDFFVAEADESDGSFLKLNPTIAITTNIDREHMDYFGSMENLKSAFISFLNKVPFYGQSIVCLEDYNIIDILPNINRKYTTYGLSRDGDFYAHNIEMEFMKSEFDLFHKGKKIERFHIPLSGIHNVLNSVASIAVAMLLRVEVKSIKEALGRFKGIKRRFEYRGESNGVKVFDDYGHHPTEIAMTIKGVKEGIKGKLNVIFQPHRYSRTKDLFDRFGPSLKEADTVYLTEIYAAGETPIVGINSERLYRKMREQGVRVVYYKENDEIVKKLREELKKEDVLITFGAGDVWKIGDQFLQD